MYILFLQEIVDTDIQDILNALYFNSKDDREIKLLRRETWSHFGNPSSDVRRVIKIIYTVQRLTNVHVDSYIHSHMNFSDEYLYLYVQRITK